MKHMKNVKPVKRILIALLIGAMIFTLSAPPAFGASAGRARENEENVLVERYDFAALIRGLLRSISRFFRTDKETGTPIDSSPGQSAQDGGQSSSEGETEKPGGQSAEERFEAEVLRLVNAERAKHGLTALTYSKELTEGAREKSRDMQKNRYFSHTSPTYGSPFDQMRARGITYRAAGENIAMGYPTPASVMDAWMNSPGHRANVLSEKYTELGVGYVAQGNYWTQWFRG